MLCKKAAAARGAPTMKEARGAFALARGASIAASGGGPFAKGARSRRRRALARKSISRGAEVMVTREAAGFNEV